VTVLDPISLLPPELRSPAPGLTLEADVPLATCGTFQLGGPARLLVTATTPDALARVRHALPHLPRPHAFIGAGSNILFADDGWPGTVVRYLNPDFTPPARQPDGTWRVSAAVELDTLAAWACTRGIARWEAFSGIPGTVGGALVGNAGAWGVQMEHMIQSVHGWDPGGNPRTWSVKDCQFSYRDSRLKHDGSWVSELTLLPAPGNPGEQQAERARILALRAEKHPDWRQTPCIGSFFKNVEPSSAAERRRAAGWFLEQVGAKTETEGGAAVYPKHANILIKAAPRCTARDVLTLARRLQKRVQEQFRLTLEPEILVLDPTELNNER
jgi:UDP-N-acetylmuramate dehydrogenase